jgi:hypothetical protein
MLATGVESERYMVPQDPSDGHLVICLSASIHVGGSWKQVPWPLGNSTEKQEQAEDQLLALVALGLSPGRGSPTQPSNYYPSLCRAPCRERAHFEGTGLCCSPSDPGAGHSGAQEQ